MAHWVTGREIIKHSVVASLDLALSVTSPGLLGDSFFTCEKCLA